MTESIAARPTIGPLARSASAPTVCTRPFLASASLKLRNIFANVFVARSGQLVSIAIEDDLRVAQDEEAHGHFAMLAFGQSDHLVGDSIELVRGHGEGILQAMGHHEGAEIGRAHV